LFLSDSWHKTHGSFWLVGQAICGIPPPPDPQGNTPEDYFYQSIFHAIFSFDHNQCKRNEPISAFLPVTTRSVDVPITEIP
jgi:hypothetical protein